MSCHVLYRNIRNPITKKYDSIARQVAVQRPKYGKFAVLLPKFWSGSFRWFDWTYLKDLKRNGVLLLCNNSSTRQAGIIPMTQHFTGIAFRKWHLRWEILIRKNMFGHHATQRNTYCSFITGCMNERRF